MKTILFNLRACSLRTLFLFCLICFSFHSQAIAGLTDETTASPEQKHYLLAQTDPDEAYDPFTDYSEFDEESDEEADVNFFRNGRFFTVGLVAGYRSFTGNLAKDYKGATAYGLYLSYFFDLRFAFQLGFQTGDHNVGFSTVNASNGKTDYSGNVSISMLNFDLKYYLNTQNVTRGLADLNPYILGGFEQVYRTYTITNLDGYSRDATMGAEIGAGVEIPLMRKKAYMGIQATYHYVSFNDENKNFLQGGTERLEHTPSGDPYDLLFILGINF